jgi:hypothetical protein
MPFKLHAEHRHHIPKRRYRVTNWPDYDAALRQRGCLTVGFTDEAITAWRAEPRTTPGQPHIAASRMPQSSCHRAPQQSRVLPPKRFRPNAINTSRTSPSMAGWLSKSPGATIGYNLRAKVEA